MNSANNNLDYGEADVLVVRRRNTSTRERQ